MASATPAFENRRAVVLGGGGPAGLAWMIGYLHHARTLVPFEQADQVLGTSAGATAAALLVARGKLKSAFDRLTDYKSLPFEAKPPIGKSDFSKAVPRIVSNSSNETEYIGGFFALADAHDVASDIQSREARRRSIRDRLSGIEDWPSERLSIVALRRGTTDRFVFNSASGIPLIDAIMASSAIPGVWPCMRASTRDFEDDFIDAGVLSGTNVDLVGEYGTIVAFQPVPNLQGERRVEDYARRRALIIEPDANSMNVLCNRMMDPSARPSAARAGYDQAVRESAKIENVWADDQH